MPLPSALAARLARRGLLQVEEPKKGPISDEVEEEVFAEDYDNDEPVKSAADDGEELIEKPPEEVHEEEEDDDEPLVYRTYACPNKVNKFHTCVDYCKDKYGYKEFKHKKNYDAKHERLLRRYPLPEEWLEVGDPDTGRYYYWHAESGQVSWLPPSHPRASISLPAEKLKASLATTDINKLIENIGAEAMEVDKSKEEEHNVEHDFEEIERELEREKRRNERKALRKKERESAREKAALDPMDPAAYSDIPRGGWSEGLEQKGSSKTGVDTTANGPLFQQRPYPSPGAVLRANKQMDGDSSP